MQILNKKDSKREKKKLKKRDEGNENRQEIHTQ
jgi:hypothetical protein